MKKLLLLIIISYAPTIFAQNQITWGTTSEISASSSFGNNFPRVIVDRSGDPMVTWSDNADMFFSKWNGSSFTTPITLNANGVNIAGPGWMGPDVASYGDTVYAVYKQTPEVDTASHVWCVSSFDGGQTFNAPVQVDDIFTGISRFPTVTVDGQGHPIVAFMKFDPGLGDPQWVVARSNDMGTSFNPDVLASGWSSGTSEVCDCCPSKIVSNGSTVAMPYRDNNNNIRDTWTGISTDGGSTFPSGMGVDQQNWLIMSCPSSGPDGVIVGDTLYTTYMNGASGSPLVSYNKSSISAMTGSVAIPLDQSPVSLVSQNYPRVDYNGGSMAFVWKQVSNGTQELAIQFTENITNGINPNQEIVDTDNVNGVDVALYDGTIWVVWEDEGTGTVKYRSGTYTSYLNTSEFTLDNIVVYPNPSNSTWKIKGIKNANEENFELVTVEGQRIDKIELSSNNGEISILNENLANGVYYLKLKLGNNIKVLKLIKN